MSTKLAEMGLDELEILCSQRGIPYKDASSADELRKRLSSKKKGNEED